MAGMESYVEELQQSQMNRSNKELEEIKKHMEHGKNKQMPKAVYDEVFKPYFTGQKPVDENTPIISKWVEYAGNVRTPVDLVDENGVVVETVPGIIRPTPADFVQGLGIDFRKLGTEYELLKDRNALEAELNVKRAMDKIANEAIKIEPDMSAFQEIVESGEAIPHDDSDEFVIYD